MMHILIIESVIYNKTDKAGWCYFAYCNSNCVSEITQKPCPQTTTVPVSTVPNDCTDVNRKVKNVQLQFTFFQKINFSSITMELK